MIAADALERRQRAVAIKGGRGARGVVVHLQLAVDRGEVGEGREPREEIVVVDLEGGPDGLEGAKRRAGDRPELAVVGDIKVGPDGPQRAERRAVDRPPRPAPGDHRHGV